MTFREDVKDTTKDENAPALPLISIVIPVHNESHVIEETLKATLQVVDRISQQYEVLIIDDGSQ